MQIYWTVWGADNQKNWDKIKKSFLEEFLFPFSWLLGVPICIILDFWFFWTMIENFLTNQLDVKGNDLKLAVYEP